MAEKVNEPVIAYKGFKRDMTCLGYQYKEGETYTTQTADVCNTGFHACEYPLDVFRYYSPGTSVYHEVQQCGEISRGEEDTKQASTEIKIGPEIGIRDLAEAAIDYTRSRTTIGHRDLKSAVSGDQGASVSGYRGASVSGYQGASVSGSLGASVSGDQGSSASGDRGASVSRGKSTVGKNGIAYARGEDAASVKVKGGIGSILVLVTENDDNYGVKSWKAEYVDGDRIKADTWYKLKNGEFVEAGEDD